MVMAEREKVDKIRMRKDKKSMTRTRKKMKMKFAVLLVRFYLLLPPLPVLFLV